MLLFCLGFSPFLFNSVSGYAGRWDREGPDKLRRAVSQQSMPWFCLPASPLACCLPFLDPMPSVACSPKTKTSKSPFLPHFLPHCQLLVNGTFTVPELLFSLGTLSLAHQTPNPVYRLQIPHEFLQPPALLWAPDLHIWQPYPAGWFVGVSMLHVHKGPHHFHQITDLFKKRQISSTPFFPILMHGTATLLDVWTRKMKAIVNSALYFTHHTPNLSISLAATASQIDLKCVYIALVPHYYFNEN